MLHVSEVQTLPAWDSQAGFFLRLPAACTALAMVSLELVVSRLGFGGAGSIVGTETVANRQVVAGDRLIAGLAGIFRRGCDVIG